MLDEEELLATRILRGKASWEEVKKYIDKNYVKRSKLEEYLKQRIKDVDKVYETLLTDIGNGVKIINVTGLSRKEKEEVVNKRNCLLVQKHCYAEILEKILEKKE